MYQNESSHGDIENMDLVRLEMNIRQQIKMIQELPKLENF